MQSAGSPVPALVPVAVAPRGATHGAPRPPLTLGVPTLCGGSGRGGGHDGGGGRRAWRHGGGGNGGGGGGRGGGSAGGDNGGWSWRARGRGLHGAAVGLALWLAQAAAAPAAALASGGGSGGAATDAGWWGATGLIFGGSGNGSGSGSSGGCGKKTNKDARGAKGGGGGLDAAELNAFVSGMVDSWRPIASNLGVSGALGACAGAALKAAGRALAAALGLGFVALQMMTYHGLVTVNWSKVHETARAALDATGDGRLDADAWKRMIKRGMVVMSQGLPSTTGFLAGFMLGLRL